MKWEGGSGERGGNGCARECVSVLVLLPKQVTLRMHGTIEGRALFVSQLEVYRGEWLGVHVSGKKV